MASRPHRPRAVSRANCHAHGKLCFGRGQVRDPTSSRHLLPGSSVPQSREQATRGIPVISTGMTVGALVQELHEEYFRNLSAAWSEALRSAFAKIEAII